ncbi:hypothetical protein JCM19233_2454 [Vibrio astriarenae]|nr:hypothetical protein JCM19233_2454 [Vibrio sp. C7]
MNREMQSSAIEVHEIKGSGKRGTHTSSRFTIINLWKGS